MYLLNSKLLVLAAIILAFASANSYAAEKITVDPNTSSAKTSDEALANVTLDTRLAQKVTYEAKGKALRIILDDLSKMTGVKLKAGYSGMDWQVRDRKMTICAKGITLAHLMNSIARVMKFKWSKSNEVTPPSYRLYMDRKTLLDADARKARLEEKYNKLTAERRKAAMENLNQLSDVKPDELSKLKDMDPYSYVLASTGIAKSLNNLLSESASMKDALASGQNIKINGASLPTSAQDALRQTMRDMWTINARNDDGNLGSFVGGKKPAIPDEVINDLSKVDIKINRESGPTSGQSSPWDRFITGEININYQYHQGKSISSDYLTFSLFAPGSSISKGIGKMLIDLENQSWDDYMKAHNNSLSVKFNPEESQEIAETMLDPEDKEDNWVKEEFNDPDLKEKIKPEYETKVSSSLQLSDHLQALSKTSKLSYVSDYFGEEDNTIGPIAQEDEVLNHLKRLSSTYYHRWQKSGSIVEFRDRYWYRKRCDQIPDEWIASWQNAVLRGSFGLNELAQIAQLSVDQFNQNIRKDKILDASPSYVVGGLESALNDNRPLLRLYARLDEMQRKMLMSPEGLDLSMLQAAQWLLAEELLKSRDSAYLQNKDAKITLKCSIGKFEKTSWYDFKVTTTDKLNPITWTVKMPGFKKM